MLVKTYFSNNVVIINANSYRRDIISEDNTPRITIDFNIDNNIETTIATLAENKNITCYNQIK